jgi:hypothetical protein
MSGQMTPNDVVVHLTRLAEELRKLVTDIDTAEIEAVNAREDFTLALSKAFLSAEGAMDMRKHRSVVATHVERIAAELADARVRGLRRWINCMNARIDIGRSMGTTLRSEISLTGRDGTP